MLRYIIQLFTRKKIAPSIDLSKVELAFSVGGTSYYKFKDHPQIPAGNMPAKRYQEFLTKHEALRMGVNREYLEDFVRRMEEVFIPDASGKGQKIDLNTIQRLIFELSTRIQIAPIGDDLYDYISVIYFPLHEDVNRYDPEFNKAKIKAWKEAEVSHDFFSIALRNMPAALTLGWSDTSPDAIQVFLNHQEKVLQTLQTLSSTPSTK